MNKIMTFVFAVAGFLSAGAATPISSGEEFIAAMSNPTGEYVLTQDINLDGCGYSSVAEFSGSLDGAGHTITGLGAQPLFTKLTGVVRGLTIDGSVGDENTVRELTGAGVLCDTAQGASVFDCAIKGYTLHHSVQDRLVQDGIGFFAGMASGRLRIERCIADASCCLYQQTIAGGECYNKPLGGIVGRLTLHGMVGTDGVAEFVDCTNRAKIVTAANWTSGSSGAGGIVGVVAQSANESTVSQAVARFTRCVNLSNLENVYLGSTSITLGGIVGMAGTSSLGINPLIDFVECVNYGRICSETRGVIYAGGILGHQSACAVVCMNGCVNRGDIGYLMNDNKWYANASGGLIGQYDRPAQRADTLLVKNCANYASVFGDNVGGLVGAINGLLLSTGDTTMSFLNSANYGTFACRTSAAEVFAVLTKSESSTVTYEPLVTIDNCWTTSPQLYASSLSTPTVTNCHTAEQDDEVARAELVAVANMTEGYVRWTTGGETGHPELFVPGAAGHEPDPVAILSDVVAAVARDGLSVDFSVTVDDVTVEDGVLRLELNGKTIQSWPLEEGAYQFKQAVKRGREYAYSFVAEAAKPNPDTTMFIEGSFLPIGEADWFAVRFSDTGYVPGPSWMSESVDPSGGTWSGVAGETELDAGTRTVSFVKTATAPAVYAPKHSSKAGAGVLISGRIRVGEVEDGSLAEGVPFAFGFAFDEATLRYRPYVIANGVKTPFGDASLTYHAWVDYSVEGAPDDNGTWTVKVVVGGIASDPVTVTVPSASVTSVGFAGGTFGDFKGLFKFFKNPGGMALLVR